MLICTIMTSNFLLNQVLIHFDMPGFIIRTTLKITSLIKNEFYCKKITIVCLISKKNYFDEYESDLCGNEHYLLEIVKIRPEKNSDLHGI